VGKNIDRYTAYKSRTNFTRIMVNKMLQLITDFLIGLSSDEKKERYLLKFPYPKKNKIFIDNRGNVSAIIGEDTLRLNSEQGLTVGIKNKANQ